MPTITVDDALWSELCRTAARAHREPEHFALEALRHYLERLADEELLHQSARDAASAPFDIEDTEAVIREYRRRHSRR